MSQKFTLRLSAAIMALLLSAPALRAQLQSPPCTDYLFYWQSKVNNMGQLNALPLQNSGTNFLAAGEFFGGTDEVTVLGFTVYYDIPVGKAGDSLQIAVDVLPVQPDSLPDLSLPPYGSDTFTLFKQHPISPYPTFEVGMFKKPIKVDGDYILVFRALSTTKFIYLFTTRFTDSIPDGQKEWLAKAVPANTPNKWRPGQAITILDQSSGNQYPFDCDLSLSPIVVYTPSLNMSALGVSPCKPNDVNVTFTPSRLFDMKWYNTAWQFPQKAIDFNTGAGTQLMTTNDTTFTYASSGTKTIYSRRLVGGWVESYRLDTFPSYSGLIPRTGYCDVRDTAMINVGTSFTFTITQNGYNLSVPVAGNLKWFRDGTDIHRDNLSMITATVSGNYWAVYSDTNSCTQNSDTVNVYICPKVTVSLSGKNLVASQSTMVSWLLEGVAVPNSNMSTFTPTKNGHYQAVFNDTIHGCKDTSAIFNYTMVGVAETLSDIGITVYPNPAHNQFTVSGLTKIAQVRLISQTGQLVLERSIVPQNGAPVTVDVSNLPVGLYNLQVSHNGNVAFQKLVIQN